MKTLASLWIDHREAGKWSCGPRGHNIMANSAESFADLSLKVVAVRTADNSDFEFEFPAAGAQSPPSALTIPLEQSMQQRLDLLAEIGAWHHGGLNE